MDDRIDAGGQYCHRDVTASRGKARPARAAERPQRAAGDATRRRLLDSGRLIFARDGFAGANTQDVVAAASVAPTALYHHFGSKLGLFVAVGSEVYDIFVGHLAAATAGSSTFGGRLDALIVAAGGLHRDDPSLAPMAITVQLEVRREAQIADEMAESLKLFTGLATDVARTAPPDMLTTHGLRAITLSVMALLNGLSSLGATLQNPDELVASTAVLRELLDGGARN